MKGERGWSGASRPGVGRERGEGLAACEGRGVTGRP